MTTRRTPDMVGPDRSTAERWFRGQGLDPEAWENAPHFTYAEHQHPYHKVLVCLTGSIVFHTPDGDHELTAGDRLDIDAGTPHSATVGPDGVECMEAAR